ncbi:MAG: LysR family transcriptional regulator [Furfurilactobacillus sp.]|uniref:LysR family transcriptional regulator n=1 Tax=Furfurilactobacillus sp. TaxID=2767911 RepID=UPI0025862966|nr:LysR family transcriptional regulator [Furfurilactobacillus sp.]MCH4010984.1 LysR family transcriptional regulator [Furfurilactobacillus sp.]MCH4036876.1 LysR family transcriptional regulator [Furfurilactobacillus sp.]MCH4114178.1 LysR family transcriptional regulator [Furfurilactobacillus sp.]MCH4132999.1 LysR family transcriptional regulator [Furfurilactobacillus sp.]MCI1339431.1 LysR family transcriptional regulator [Furfurilactobacillus sp.]
MTTMNQNQQLLRILSSLQTTGSISDTANEMYLTQPNVSKQLKRFETELGVRLVDRSTHPLSLTAAGNYYLNQMSVLISQVDRVITTTQAFKTAKHATLRLGVTQSLGSILLPNLLPAFHRRHPEVTLELHELPPAQGEQALTSNQLDIYFGVAPTLQPEITHIPLYSEGCTLIMPKNALANVNSQDVNTNLETILFNFPRQEIIVERGDSGFQRIVSGYLAAHNIHPWRTFVTANLITAERLAAKGMGAAIVPNSLVETGKLIADVTAIRLPSDELSLSVVAQINKQAAANAVIADFLQMDFNF